MGSSSSTQISAPGLARLTEDPDDSQEKLKECFDAVKADKLSEVEALLKSGGFDINGRVGLGYERHIRRLHKNRETLLHAAKSKDMAHLLVHNGADVMATNEYGKTSLHSAVLRNEIGVCEVLIKEKADVNARSDDGETPLIENCQAGGSVQLAKLLISNGADVNAADDLGYTALYIAAGIGETELCRVLLDGGAKPNAQDRDGGTPLHQCAFMGQLEATRLLIKRGAKAHIENNEKKLPISYLRESHEHFDEFKTLLQETFDKRHNHIKSATHRGDKTAAPKSSAASSSTSSKEKKKKKKKEKRN